MTPEGHDRVNLLSMIHVPGKTLHGFSCGFINSEKVPEGMNKRKRIVPFTLSLSSPEQGDAQTKRLKFAGRKDDCFGVPMVKLQEGRRLNFLPTIWEEELDIVHDMCVTSENETFEQSYNDKATKNDDAEVRRSEERRVGKECRP